MGMVFARGVMRAALARSGIGVMFARSGRRPLTRICLGWLMPVGNVTADAAARHLRLLQRVWYSSDAQNEHEKGHGENDAHFARQ
jgi:hypothetical protein